MGILEVLDTTKSLITHSQQIKGAGHILDILEIEDDTHYLLSTTTGIVKITQDFQLLNRYYEGVKIFCVSHLSGSCYLLGVHSK